MVIRINVYRVIPVSDKTLNNTYKLGSTNYVAFYKTALQTKTEKVRKASYTLQTKTEKVRKASYTLQTKTEKVRKASYTLQTKTEKVRKASYNTRLYTISTKLDVRT